MSDAYIPNVKKNIRKEDRWINPSGTKTYHSWNAMRSRCYRPTNKDFKIYGGRGIKVCDRWLNDYDAFFDDMGVRPDGTTLDRIDSNGDYSPDNCRWVTIREQQQNKRSNVFFEVNGVSLPVAEWARRYGLNRTVLMKRIRRGVQGDALFSPEPTNAPSHGTNNMYSKLGCRCDECKEFNRIKSKKARDALKRRKAA